MVHIAIALYKRHCHHSGKTGNFRHACSVGGLTRLGQASMWISKTHASRTKQPRSAAASRAGAANAARQACVDHSSARRPSPIQDAMNDEQHPQAWRFGSGRFVLSGAQGHAIHDHHAFGCWLTVRKGEGVWHFGAACGPGGSPKPRAGCWARSPGSMAVGALLVLWRHRQRDIGSLGCGTC
jgi:hypothetical protein